MTATTMGLREWAILLGVAFPGESLAPRHIAGMAAIAAGLRLITRRQG